MKTTFYIEILKDLIKKEFSPRTLTLLSCDDLALDIFHRTGDTISASTLQRVFDFVVKTSAISKGSLNILSSYVNYANWDSFCINQEDPNLNFQENYFPDEMGLRLFDISLKNHDFATVIDYLKVIPVEAAQELPEQVYKMSSIFGHVFRKDSVARKALLPELAKTEQGRLFFYENFVDVEWHNGYYADSMFYYKKHINVNSKQLSTRDFVFASTIEIYNYTQKNRKKLTIKRSYDLVKKLSPEEACVSSIGHVIPTARYFATFMIYSFLTKSLTDKLLHRITTSIDSLISPTHPSSTNTFIINELFRALRYCKRYDEVVWSYESYQSSNIKFNHPAKYHESILKTVNLSYQKTGRYHNYHTFNFK